MSQRLPRQPRGTAPSSLGEVGERLDELVTSQDMIFEAIDRLTRQIELALAATRTSANEAAEVHQERVELVRRVARLEAELALLKESAA